MTKKILVIKGDSRKEGYMKKMAQIYAEQMEQEGFEVSMVDLRTLNFNVTLSEGYNTIRPEEFLKVRTALHEADLVAFFYPIWMANIPAVLKGFIENLFWVRETYSFKDHEYFFKGKLRGKKASLFYSLGGKEFYHKLFGHAGYMALRHPLWISGIFSIRKTVFENLDTRKRKTDQVYLKLLDKQIQKDKRRLEKKKCFLF